MATKTQQYPDASLWAAATEDTPHYRTTPENNEASSRARAALEAYQGATGESAPMDTGTVRCLIQDIMHWQQQRDPQCDARETIKEAFGFAYEDFANEAKGRS